MSEESSLDHIIDWHEGVASITSGYNKLTQRMYYKLETGDEVRTQTSLFDEIFQMLANAACHDHSNECSEYTIDDETGVRVFHGCSNQECHESVGDDYRE